MLDQLMTILSDYYILINIILIALVIILFITTITVLVSISKLKKRYRRVTRGTNNKNLEELLNNSLDKIEEIEENANKTVDVCNEYMKKTNSCIQKVTIKRYKAFDDVGSDLSYSIAMLDGSNNGIILTSIYSRSESVTYAKPIDNGISRYDLSEEEENVLYEAINK